MSLFGHLEITTTDGGVRRIGSWSARRLGPVDREGRNKYECDVVMPGPSGGVIEDYFTVSHRYDDGAAWLASLVLRKAATRSRS